ncbi:3,4-dihydroxy-2-butanone-4-phosphate synthase [Macrococcoides caseolyticum]|uniref:3,4-dihydroxy-2-butanone-4-phosphate synthase n=1 Tax=Macrococcoides caseolyticum TaxID=69966 RepID=UPI001EED8764|nr:3,4-dihydroxy-2-butanone-4-phosphate synthase [Macrococcus caseolyticus]MCE4956406.1 3,4-dihydroxy-2-butanone-4-phosphate synthase [Macrococcus caseolyticus]
MFDDIESAIKELKQGKPIIVVDNEDRENEGDLVALTDFMTEDTINFMIKHARGLVCAPISTERNKKLNLLPMTFNNQDPNQTAFTVSVDHVSTTTGISAFERFCTVKALADPNVSLQDFNQPGHIFPLIAKPNGVLERAGHTEACVDLAKLCGASETGVICEIIKEDGTMARRDDLAEYKLEHNLLMITIADLVDYIKTVKPLVKREAEIKMPTEFGDFKMYGFSEIYGDKEHVVYVKDYEGVPDIRIHSECLTGDVFHSKRCDCGIQLERGMQHINEHGGILIYLRQEGRGIGLINKLKAYEKIEQGMDTVEANHALGFESDMRDYAVAASILKDLGVTKVNLMSNNPRKMVGLSKYGIEVQTRIPHQFQSNEVNKFYLSTKKEKLGHLLEEKLI